MNNRELYNYLHTHAEPNGRIYNMGMRRDGVYVQYMIENVPIGSSVFDAGCGRGKLIQWLRTIGYEASGCEIIDALMRNGLDLCGQNVMDLDYGDLGRIHDDTYDVVISNDVLEHLQGEEFVLESLDHLVRISKKWFLMSTACGPARNPFGRETGVKNLHTFMRNFDWWTGEYKKRCELLATNNTLPGSMFFFGVKK